jgi:hypothetical protein
MILILLGNTGCWWVGKFVTSQTKLFRERRKTACIFVSSSSYATDDQETFEFRFNGQRKWENMLEMFVKIVRKGK